MMKLEITSIWVSLQTTDYNKLDGEFLCVYGLFTY
jgi:hypothetical protein